MAGSAAHRIISRKLIVPKKLSTQSNSFFGHGIVIGQNGLWKKVGLWKFISCPASGNDITNRNRRTGWRRGRRIVVFSTRKEDKHQGSKPEKMNDIYTTEFQGIHFLFQRKRHCYSQFLIPDRAYSDFRETAARISNRYGNHRF